MLTEKAGLQPYRMEMEKWESNIGKKTKQNRERRHTHTQEVARARAQKHAAFVFKDE